MVLVAIQEHYLDLLRKIALDGLLEERPYDGIDYANLFSEDENPVSASLDFLEESLL